jgi:5-methylcytosine-specific restriction endonuclease McrA
MYNKQQQTKKKTRTHRVCKKCDRKRLIKFYEKPTSLICEECKRKAKRVKKKSSKSYLNDIKDKKWSQAIKIRDNHECQYCGKDKYLNSHHIYTRNNFTVRWDLDNGITLCSGCHTMSSKFSAHKTPLEFIEWLKEFWGIDRYERLRSKARKVNK